MIQPFAYTLEAKRTVQSTGSKYISAEVSAEVKVQTMKGDLGAVHEHMTMTLQHPAKPIQQLLESSTSHAPIPGKKFNIHVSDSEPYSISVNCLSI